MRAECWASACTGQASHQPGEGPPGVGKAGDEDADDDEDADAHIVGDLVAGVAREVDAQQHRHDDLGRDHLQPARQQQHLRGERPESGTLPVFRTAMCA